MFYELESIMRDRLDNRLFSFLFKIFGKSLFLKNIHFIREFLCISR